MDDKLTIKEAAEYLGVSRVKVNNLIRQGMLTAESNVLDAREKLIPLPQLADLKTRGRRQSFRPLNFEG